MTSIGIVVAQYEESVEWCQDSAYAKFDKYIYRKSHDLPNVGREAHTYVSHIIKHYDALDNITVFVQGNPFDHLPVGGFDQMISDAQRHPSGLSQNADFHERGCNNAYFNFTIRNHMGNAVQPFVVVRKSPRELVFGEWLKEVCEIQYNTSPRWYIGACFAAKREAIRSVSLERWRTILESLSYDANPVTGHYMERAWYMLMDLEKAHMTVVRCKIL